MVSSRIEIHSLLPLLNDRQVLQNEKATHAVNTSIEAHADKCKNRDVPID